MVLPVGTFASNEVSDKQEIPTVDFTTLVKEKLSCKNISQFQPTNTVPSLRNGLAVFKNKLF